MPYDVDAIRKKLKASMSGKFSDPDEFRPEKAKSASEAVKYRFFICPPLIEGDKLKSGTVARGMDSQFFVAHGNHWVNDKPYPCPRIWTGEKCPICDFGFDLLKDEKIKGDDAKRQSVVKQWMPTQYYMMNIFFPNVKENPEDLRNRVMFYNAPKTVIDICTACLMRDDAGDPESPEAFGVFFDENNAFPFELQVLKQGRNNSYKTSKFLATPRAIVRNSDGSPNPKAIAAVLTLRHDLFAKIEEPNMDKIKRIYEVMQNGDDSGSDGKGGFDNDETAAAATTAPAKAAPAGKTDPGNGKGVATAPAKTGTTTKAAAAATPPATKAAPAAAPAKKAAPPVEEEDDAASILAAATATEEAPPKAASAKKAAPAPAEEPLAAEAPVEAPADEGGEVNSTEIDNLLGQLEDDD